MRIAVPDLALGLKCGKGEGYAHKLSCGDYADKKDIGSTRSGELQTGSPDVEPVDWTRNKSTSQGSNKLPL